MTYRYFVAFAYPPGAAPAFGNAEIERDRPIAGEADVRGIEAGLAVRGIATAVVVTGWRQFEDDPETE